MCVCGGGGGVSVVCVCGGGWVGGWVCECCVYAYGFFLAFFFLRAAVSSIFDSCSVRMCTARPRIMVNEPKSNTTS